MRRLSLAPRFGVERGSSSCRLRPLFWSLRGSQATLWLARGSHRRQEVRELVCARPAGPDEIGGVPAVAPASLVLSDGSRVLLEPTLLWDRQVTAAGVRGAICDPDEVSFGLGCAEVEDDRVIVRPPVEPILWTIEGGHGAEVRARATRRGSSFVRCLRSSR